MVVAWPGADELVHPAGERITPCGRDLVGLWYGEEDTLTPLQMGRYLESRIDGAQLTVFPGEGHMAAFTHWDEVVAALIP